MKTSPLIKFGHVKDHINLKSLKLFIDISDEGAEINCCSALLV